MSVVKRQLFIGIIVSPKALDTLEIFHGFVAVENGKITNVGNKEQLAKLETAGVYQNWNKTKMTDEQFLLPGFVDCHTHAPQFPNLGLGLDKPLLEWLDKYTFPLESKYSKYPYFAMEVYNGVVETMLLNGTTTACYFGTIHYESTLQLVSSIRSHKQRALVGKVSMNVQNDAGYYNDTQKELQETEQFVRAVSELENHGLVTPVVTPRFAVSCDEELMKGLAKIASKYKVPIQSHISENAEEVELVMKTYPHCDNYADVYDKCNLLNERSIMAHAVHLSDEEITLLVTRGVSIAHCPASNTRLHSGMCPVRKLLDRGLTMGLGTDVSGGDSPSMLHAMRRAMDVSTHLQMSGENGAALKWTEALYLATLGGAKALNLGDQIGNFEIGKDFDALLIDSKAWGCRLGCRPDASRPDYATELVQRFIYIGDDRNIAKVYVKGRITNKDI